MKKEKIVIIDDDVVFAQQLKKKVLKYFDEEITILNFFDWDFMNTNKVDLLFLDIELREKGNQTRVNGIEEAIKIRNMKRWDIEIIFITSHSNFISSSFDAGPLYFINKFDLNEKLPRAIDTLKRKGFRQANPIQIGDQCVNINDIMYLSSEKHYVYFWAKHAESNIKLRITLNRIEALGINSFVRIHKSYFVNMQFIKKSYRDKVILLDDSELRVSRKYHDSFKKRYKSAKLKDSI